MWSLAGFPPYPTLALPRPSSTIVPHGLDGRKITVEQELLKVAAWGRDAWDFIGNNAANIIALTAAAVVATQAWLTREHNRLSVRPHLQTHIDTQTNFQESVFYYSVELRNNGLGPAIVKKWSVFLDGVEQQLQTREEVDTFIKGLISNFLSLKTRFFGPDEVMRANDSQTILALKLPLMSTAGHKDFEKQLNRLGLVVEYTSMYGERLRPLDTRK
jgi:hypothetical protein